VPNAGLASVLRGVGVSATQELGKLDGRHSRITATS
jgi:hypothetical protein